MRCEHDSQAGPGPENPLVHNRPRRQAHQPRKLVKNGRATRWKKLQSLYPACTRSVRGSGVPILSLMCRGNVSVVWMIHGFSLSQHPVLYLRESTPLSHRMPLPSPSTSNHTGFSQSFRHTNLCLSVWPFPTTGSLHLLFFLLRALSTTLCLANSSSRSQIKLRAAFLGLPHKIKSTPIDLL